MTEMGKDGWNMSIKRKGVILVLLVGILSTAVYLSGNYEDPALDITKSVETGKNLGEAQQVMASDATQEDAQQTMAMGSYFDKARLTRQQSRDEAVELLEEVAYSEASDENTIQMALQQITTLAQYTEQEGRMENLIRAKGFQDCVVSIGEEGVNVTVSGEGLDDQMVAQIQDIVISETGVSGDQIRINEAKA